jgi:CheY-like chemotaxis protein
MAACNPEVIRETLTGYDSLPSPPEVDAMPRILVIDDDLSVGSAIQLMMARHGCDTVFVQSAAAGVRAFDISPFDSVMVDIFMPGVDGLETIKAFRERAPAVPIIAMSGFRFRNSNSGAPDYLALAAKFGATSCLRKPFTLQQLLEAVAGVVTQPASPRVAVSLIPEQGSVP